jgi:arsenate reductase (thioredoxin)
MSKKRIVFVCVENSCRSQLAEAFAHIHSKGDWEVYSAGSRPSGRVNPKAIETMSELGYDLAKHESKSLDQLPVGEYDAAITMGCGDECPMIAARFREDWGLPDPKHMNLDQFREIRNLIEAKVKDLIKKLS